MNATTLRKRLLIRAFSVCECTGQCGQSHRIDGKSLGSGRCSAPNTEVIARDRRNPVRWRRHTHNSACLTTGCDDGMESNWSASLVVLAVTHEKGTTDEDHALMLCQVCRKGFVKRNPQQAKIRRRRKQQELLP